MASRLFDWREDRAHLSACGEMVHLRTRERVEVVDLSELVAERVRRSAVDRGVASVRVVQAAAALFVEEDFLAGTPGARASSPGASLTLSVTGGRLVLGEGRRIFLVDRAGPRTCLVSLVVLGAPLGLGHPHPAALPHGPRAGDDPGGGRGGRP